MCFFVLTLVLFFFFFVKSIFCATLQWKPMFTGAFENMHTHGQLKVLWIYLFKIMTNFFFYPPSTLLPATPLLFLFIFYFIVIA